MPNNNYLPDGHIESPSKYKQINSGTDKVVKTIARGKRTLGDLCKLNRKAFSLVEVLTSLLVLGIVAQMITINVHQLINFKILEEKSYFKYQADRLILDLNHPKLNLKFVMGNTKIDRRPVYHFYSKKNHKDYRLIVWHRRLVLTGSNKGFMPLSKDIYVEKILTSDKPNCFNIIIRELEHLKHTGRNDDCLYAKRMIYLNND